MFQQLAEMPYARYFIATGGIALVLGGLLGFVIRSISARRQIYRLNAELDKVRQQLAEPHGAAAQPIPSRQPPGWTRSEIMQVLLILGALIGSLRSLYVKYEEMELSGLAQAEAILGYRLPLWRLSKLDVPKKELDGPPTFFLDQKDSKGSCDAGKPALAYSGYDPAILHCPQGDVTFHLNVPAKLLFISEPLTPPKK